MHSSTLTIVKVKVNVLDNLTDGARSINPVRDIRFEMIHQGIHVNVSPLAVRFGRSLGAWNPTQERKVILEIIGVRPVSGQSFFDADDFFEQGISDGVNSSSETTCQGLEEIQKVVSAVIFFTRMVFDFNRAKLTTLRTNFFKYSFGWIACFPW